MSVVFYNNLPFMMQMLLNSNLRKRGEARVFLRRTARYRFVCEGLSKFCREYCSLALSHLKDMVCRDSNLFVLASVRTRGPAAFNFEVLGSIKYKIS
jgi:hypothetical protein